MKKVCFSFFCGLLMLVSIALGAIVAAATTEKRVSGFYRSDFTKGIAYEGPMHL